MNESAQDKLIRELKEENARLLEMLEKKKMILDDNEHLNRSSTIINLKQPEYETKPHLMNINEDPLLTGHIWHILDEGSNKIGK